MFILIICVPFLVFVSSCELYLAPSKIPGAGRGVIAGSHMRPGQSLNSLPSLLVREEDLLHTQLNNYAFESEERGYSILVFGAGMMYNYRSRGADVIHSWDSPTVPPSSSIKLFPHTTYTNVEYNLGRKGIEQGDEIFFDYGKDSWFLSRNLTVGGETTSTRYDVKELETVGICESNLYSAPSSIPGAGRGSYSKVAHKKGDIVAVSPVLMLPLHRVMDPASTRSTILLNYCITSPGSDAALFPFSMAGMMNHASQPNVVLEWFDWDGEKRSDRNVLELEQSAFAPLDLGYRATRDIEVGEELFLSYGKEWEIAWNDHNSSVSENSQFRHSIKAPNGLFPPHFASNCIGSRDCIGTEFDKTVSAQRKNAKSNVASALNSAREKLAQRRKGSTSAATLEL